MKDGRGGVEKEDKIWEKVKGEYSERWKRDEKRVQGMKEIQNERKIKK